MNLMSVPEPIKTASAAAAGSECLRASRDSVVCISWLHLTEWKVVPFFLLILAMLLHVSRGTLSAAEFSPTARNFLDHFCVECHDADVHKGNLRVDQLLVANPDRDQFNRLVLLFDRVQRNEMPPRKADQPETAERAAFLAELRASLIALELKQPLASVRRLNRVEYEDTLRDLLHLPVLRVKELLPEDPQQAGFDKVGAALDFSPVLVGKYMEAADVALKGGSHACRRSINKVR